jgi:dipeptidyl-peptidase-4
VNLGTHETQDQLAAAQHFGKLGFVDSSRIGLWGWVRHATTHIL